MALRAQTQLMLAGFLRFADHLERASSGLVSGVSVSDDALREAALSSLRSWRDHPDEDRSAIAIVIAAEWLQQMGLLVSDLEAPVDQAVEAARLPWWRS